MMEFVSVLYPFELDSFLEFHKLLHLFEPKNRRTDKGNFADERTLRGIYE